MLPRVAVSRLSESRNFILAGLRRGLTASVATVVSVGSVTAIAAPANWVAQAPYTSSPNVENPDASASETSTPTLEDANRFGCQIMDGEYTVVYYPESQPGEAYPWAKPTLMGGGWTPEARCAEISRRLESYRPDGLIEMRTSLENGYDIVCVTTQVDPSCRIVLTVPPGQDPIATRDRVFENLAVADTGQRTDAVTTYTDEGRILTNLGELLNVDLSDIPGLTGSSERSNDAIDLRPFLDESDGGTGEMLD